MTWRRAGDKPLSDPMMGSLLPHICVTRPQWVKQPILFLSWLSLIVWKYSILFYCLTIYTWAHGAQNMATFALNTCQVQYGVFVAILFTEATHHRDHRYKLLTCCRTSIGMVSFPGDPMRDLLEKIPLVLNPSRIGVERLFEVVQWLHSCPQRKLEAD